MLRRDGFVLFSVRGSRRYLQLSSCLNWRKKCSLAFESEDPLPVSSDMFAGYPDLDESTGESCLN